jgi:hypothetical protein
LSGGEVSGNTGNGVVVTIDGGYIDSRAGTFTMTGGKVSGNTAVSGGGVAVSGGYYGTGGNTSRGVFTMTGGEISGNTALGINYRGGGGGGGGVFVGDYSDFTMSGGEISGNTARGASYDGIDAAGGGGVFVAIDSVFKKEPVLPGGASGIIYGSDGGAKSNKTVNYQEAIDDHYGPAVLVHARYDPPLYWRRVLTAGENDSLDSTTTQAQGGGWVSGWGE